MVLHHAFDIQFFDGNHAETVDQFSRLLMHEVVTAVLDALMYAPNDFLRGFPLFGTVLVLDVIKPALRFRQSILFVTEEARVFNKLAIRESGEGFKSNVNTNGLRAGRKAFGLIITRKADVPLIAFTTNGTSLDCARTNAVDFGFDLPDLGKRDSAFSNAIAALRISDAVVLPFAFQSWVARFFSCFDTTKEGLKSEFHADDDILQYLRMHRRQFRMRRLPRGYSLLLLVQGWRFA